MNILKIVFLGLALSASAYADQSTCEFTIQSPGKSPERKTFHFKKSDFVSLGEYFGQYYVQVATLTDGPADGPVGKPTGIQALIFFEVPDSAYTVKILGESDETYALRTTNLRQELSSTAPGETEPTTALLECRDL